MKGAKSKQETKVNEKKQTTLGSATGFRRGFLDKGPVPVQSAASSNSVVAPRMPSPEGAKEADPPVVIVRQPRPEAEYGVVVHGPVAPGPAAYDDPKGHVDGGLGRVAGAKQEGVREIA